jgi:hypothetical protein
VAHRESLDLPDAEKGAYEPVADPEQQWPVPGENSPRYRVRNNLPGTPEFCPLVFLTQALQEFAAMDLVHRAQEAVANVPKDILARTAAFLLLKDSRASYAIEGERPPRDRIQRWGRAIGEAGRRSIELDELLRLQAIVIGDARFVRLGLGKRADLSAKTIATPAFQFLTISAPVRTMCGRCETAWSLLIVERRRMWTR